jgi:hypothetical protein
MKEMYLAETQDVKDKVARCCKAGDLNELDEPDDNSDNNEIDEVEAKYCAQAQAYQR